MNAASGTARAFDARRICLFVSSREPLAAADALWRWAEMPPDLCVTSPSTEAHTTAAFAFAGHFVQILDEPLLARRAPGESAADFGYRYATALRALYALDMRAALVVCDDFPERWTAPFVVAGDELLAHSERIERRLQAGALDVSNHPFELAR
jgi:hypothetical protein